MNWIDKNFDMNKQLVRNWIVKLSGLNGCLGKHLLSKKLSIEPRLKVCDNFYFFNNYNQVSAISDSMNLEEIFQKYGI